MTKTYDDETLMAFADGELEGERAAEIALLQRTDAELAARISAFAAARASARAAYAPLLDEPVPPALLAAVERMASAATRPDNVVALPMARSSRRPMATAGQLALAAGLAAVSFALGGYLLAPPAASPPDSPLRLAALELPAIAAELDRQPSGHVATLADGATLRIVSSFRDGDESLCREFEITSQARKLVSVACGAEQGWQTRFAAIVPPADASYAPASSHDLVDSYLDGVAAGAPLGPEEEAAALSGRTR